MSINLSPKLLEIIKEVNDAVTFLQESRPVISPNDVRMLRANINIIEKGEKRIQKEFAKRNEELSNIQKEMELINTFSAAMGYTLSDVAPEPVTEGADATEGDETLTNATPETPPEPETEVLKLGGDVVSYDIETGENDKETGIKITVGKSK